MENHYFCSEGVMAVKSMGMRKQHPFPSFLSIVNIHDLSSTNMDFLKIGRGGGIS